MTPKKPHSEKAAKAEKEPKTEAPVPAKEPAPEAPKEVAKEEAKETPKEPVKKNGKKILVVEDEKPLAHALELKLTHEGYDVTVAYTGEDGLREIQKEGYSLVLLDLILPGIDGFAVLEQAKAQAKNIIVLSNLGQEEDRKKAEALGAKNYLVKSNVPLTEIVKVVRAAI